MKDMYVVHNGKKYYIEDLERMNNYDLTNVSLDVQKQQLNTSLLIDRAGSLKTNGTPIDSHDYYALKNKIKILNYIMTQISIIKKKNNIAKSKDRDKILIEKLRSFVGEDKFFEIVAEVDKEVEK
ncbi:MAG: hypothetical protein M0R51_11645 [Clostridia bacterium]|jgi:hypothetical protein|nr:hypothetical protein [Clostridia bacterium]